MYGKKDGQPLSFRSQHSWLVPVRENNHILYNAASELELPRLERRLPKHVLTIREAEAVLAVPDLSDPPKHIAKCKVQSAECKSQNGRNALWQVVVLRRCSGTLQFALPLQKPRMRQRNTTKANAQ